MDVSSWLRKQLEQAHPDLLRVMVKEMVEALMAPRSTPSAAPPTASGPGARQPP